MPVNWYSIYFVILCHACSRPTSNIHDSMLIIGSTYMYHHMHINASLLLVLAIISCAIGENTQWLYGFVESSEYFPAIVLDNCKLLMNKGLPLQMIHHCNGWLFQNISPFKHFLYRNKFCSKNLRQWMINPLNFHPLTFYFTLISCCVNNTQYANIFSSKPFWAPMHQSFLLCCMYIL